MTGSTAQGSSQPAHINILTSQVTQHGAMRLINRPESVVMAWEAAADLDLASTAKYLGVNNLRHETGTHAVTGKPQSIAYTEFTHEEYEAYRQSQRGRTLELPPQPAEQQGNTLGTLIFMPSPNPIRAKHANPPAIPPTDIKNPEAPPGERTSTRLEELKAQREAHDKKLINPDAADQYVNFSDTHNTVDGWIGAIKGTPGTAGDYAAQATRGVLGFVKDAFLGIGELAYEGGKLAVSTQQATSTPAGIYGKLLDAQILAEEIRVGNVTTGTMTAGAINAVTDVGKAIVAPITQPWAQGQYVESVTRGVVEIATLPLAALKSGKIAKAGNAASDIATVSKAANGAADVNKATYVDDVSQTPKLKEPNGSGGKVLASNRLSKKNLQCFKKNKKGDQKEYDRQLKGQQDGLNNMTAKEYLDGRAAYTGNRASTVSVREKYEKELRDNYIDSGAAKTRAEAKKLASDKMKTLNALHNPDMIVGGKDAISDFGDASVNKSIGSQWNKKMSEGGLSRVEILDKEAEYAMANGYGDHKMNAYMHRCP